MDGSPSRGPEAVLRLVPGTSPRGNAVAAVPDGSVKKREFLSRADTGGKRLIRPAVA